MALMARMEIDDPQEYALDVGARPGAMRVYRSVVFFIRRVLNPYFRVEVRGNVENLDATGPLILAPVHRSNLDSVLVGGSSSRRCRALAKRSMFDNKPFAWLISSLGAFPVERGTADREALNAARMLLDNGEAMFVFPEGTRQVGRDVGEIFDGVAWLAAKTGARALPIAIAGTGEAMPKGAKFPKRQTVVLQVGDLIDPPAAAGRRVTMSDRSNYSAALGDSLTELMEAAYARYDERQRGGS